MMEKVLLMGPSHKHGLTLIPAWISNHMPITLWDEITHPFPNSKSVPLKHGYGWVISPTLYNRCNYLTMLALKLIYVNKKGPLVCRKIFCKRYRVWVEDKNQAINSFVATHTWTALCNDLSSWHMGGTTWKRNNGNASFLAATKHS